MTAPVGSSTLGSAVVRVVADVRRFASSVRSSVSRALGGRGSGSIYYSASYAGRQAGNAFATRFAQSAASGLQRAGRGLAKIFTTLLSPAALMTGTKILGIVAGLKQLILLGPAVAGLGQILAAVGAALPALAIAGVLVGKTISLAFKGVGEAMKAVAEGDAEALAEAMKSLTPAAQSFIKEVQAIQPEFKKLQQAVQESFFTPFKGGFSELANPAVLAALRGAMTGIADSLGRAAKGVADVVGAAGRSGQLSRIFSPLERSIERIVSLAPSMTKAFLGMAEVAGPFIEQFSVALGGKLAGLIAKVNAAASDGTLKSFFETAIDAAAAFASVIKDLGRIFGAVFDALNVEGASVVGTLGTLIATLADFFETAEGAEALSTLGTLISQLGGLLGAVVGPLLAPLGKLITLLGTNLSLALRFLMPALTLLAEAFAGLLGPVFEALAPVLQDLVIQLAGPLAAALITVAEHIKEMTPVAVEMVQIFGPALSQVLIQFGDLLIALLPFLSEFAEILSENAWLFKVLAGVIGAVFALLAGGIYVLEILVWLFGEFASFMKDDVWGNFPIVLSLITGAAFSMLEALQGPINSLGELWDAVVNGGEQVLAFLGGVPGRIAGMAGAFFGSAASLGAAIGRGFAQIGNFASDVGGKIVGTIKSGLNAIVGSINRGIAQIDNVIPGSLPRLGFFAKGGIIDSPTIGVMGEGGRREVVLPLTDPARSAQLAQESGLMDVLRAGGLGGGAPVINITAILDGFGVMRVVDQRVQSNMNQQGAALAAGARGI